MHSEHFVLRAALTVPSCAPAALDDARQVMLRVAASRLAPAVVRRASATLRPWPEIAFRPPATAARRFATDQENEKMRESAHHEETLKPSGPAAGADDQDKVDVDMEVVEVEPVDTLEWTLSSPPPVHQFDEPPIVVEIAEARDFEVEPH